jgi:glutamyl-tRNA synthetase
MTDNYNDIVLLKSDGLPTYHLAHIVDDSLMRMSHIIRAEERMPSVPLHIQLFNACGLPVPKYCHLAQILKLDEGKKRKLSKRKDPEANVAYFFEHGYAVQ